MILRLSKMQYLFLVFGLAAVALVQADNLTPVVQTSSGPVRGLEVSYEGTNYSSFRGIPYAAPPVGDLRFRPPQPAAKWTEVLNATNFGKMCYAHKGTDSPNTSEDCLTLDVYTPTLLENASKSVMVSIHGGGFRGGDGTDRITGPQYLMQHDIVIVSIEYRLGPIGFLATNSSDASGNWGMKDQVAALRWVQENIRHFGGNPDDVTIYGESAGGASVHLHLFSPLTKGLFHKVISASGSALNKWTLREPYYQERYSRNLARLVGAPEDVIEDRAKRVEFLRRSGAKQITDSSNNVASAEERNDPLFSAFSFTPVIEHADVEGAYLTEDPKKMLAEGRYHRVPILMGNNDLEGAAGKPPTPEAMRKIEDNVCQILPPPLKSRALANFACRRIARMMKDAYFDGKPFESSPLNYVYLWADVSFIRDIYFSQKGHAMYSNETTPIYNYYFTFDGQWNIFKKMLKVTLPGAVHGDEMPYMFKPNGIDIPVLPPTSREVITQKRWTTMIANFVKQGNPTPEISDLIPVKWEPATKDQQKTMVIGDDLKLEKDVFKKRMDMWEALYKKYGY